MKNALKRAFTIAAESLRHPTVTSVISHDGKVISRNGKSVAPKGPNA